MAVFLSTPRFMNKENIVGTMGILYGGGDLTVWQTLGQAFTGVTGFSFLVFNLLCAPCFAAMAYMLFFKKYTEANKLEIKA